MQKKQPRRAVRPIVKNRVAAVDTKLVRSEGQRLLLQVPGSLGDIAMACHMRSRTNVNDWRNGIKIPDADSRAQLWGAYGIPALSWSQPPAAGGKREPPARTPPPDVSNAGPPATTLDSCLLLLAKIRKESERDLLPSERVKLADTEARILTLRHKLESEAALTEDRIIREHPRWVAVKRTILDALDGHPDASKAVCDALARLGSV